MVLRWIFLERIIRFIQVVILVYHTHTADKVDSVMHSTWSGYNRSNSIADQCDIMELSWSWNWVERQLKLHLFHVWVVASFSDHNSQSILAYVDFCERGRRKSACFSCPKTASASINYTIEWWEIVWILRLSLSPSLTVSVLPKSGGNSPAVPATSTSFSAKFTLTNFRLRGAVIPLHILSINARVFQTV